MPKSLGRPGERNRLLAGLPKTLGDAVQPHLTLERFARRMSIEHPSQAIERVVFPIDCIGSIVAVSRSGRRIEVGLFGFDGMSGTSLVSGAGSSPLETFIQIAGSGHSMTADALRGLMDEHPSLRAYLARYVHCLTMQTAHTALSNGHAKLEERLARWLLMCHDRVRGDRMTLTHEFLSVMLGVRRAGVTVGTHVLEGKGLIRAERGVITILDRDGLIEEARDGYGTAEREYVRLFGVSDSDDGR